MANPLRTKGKRSKWTRTFILHVVKTVLEANLTNVEAARRFNLSCPRMVSRWVMKYHSELEELNSIGPMATNSPMAQDNDSCTEQTKMLQKALDQAQLKVTALETMIDLAESTYQISIRKNFGTKQHE